jgi:hypothetical protein
VQTPNSALPTAACSLGYDSYGNPRTMPGHPRKPDGRDLAEVALPGLPMTHPDTIRPHPVLKMTSYFFSNLTL